MCSAPHYHRNLNQSDPMPGRHTVTTKSITSSAANEMTLATYYARQAVKAQWKKQGKRHSQIEAGELQKAAADWLKEHPELVWLAGANLNNFVQRKRR
jgi:hypothetical protein